MPVDNGKLSKWLYQNETICTKWIEYNGLDIHKTQYIYIKSYVQMQEGLLQLLYDIYEYFKIEGNICKDVINKWKRLDVNNAKLKLFSHFKIVWTS